jgi:hypothetical protein
VTIPETRTELSLPLENLSKLPAGSTYSNRNGQANVSLRFENDTIYVDAVCDSLSRRVEYYEMELNRMRNEAETQLKIEEKTPVQTMFKWCLIGVLIGSVITIIITKTIKK